MDIQLKYQIGIPNAVSKRCFLVSTRKFRSLANQNGQKVSEPEPGISGSQMTWDLDCLKCYCILLEEKSFLSICSDRPPRLRMPPDQMCGHLHVLNGVEQCPNAQQASSIWWRLWGPPPMEPIQQVSTNWAPFFPGNRRPYRIRLYGWDVWTINPTLGMGLHS